MGKKTTENDTAQASARRSNFVTGRAKHVGCPISTNSVSLSIL